MAKTTKQPKARRRPQSRELTAAHESKKQLQRLVRVNRQVSRLTNELRNAISRADRGLIDFCRTVLEHNDYVVTLSPAEESARDAAIEHATV